jgi:hypothetical protein
MVFSIARKAIATILQIPTVTLMLTGPSKRPARLRIIYDGLTMRRYGEGRGQTSYDEKVSSCCIDATGI